MNLGKVLPINPGGSIEEVLTVLDTEDPMLLEGGEGLYQFDMTDQKALLKWRDPNCSTEHVVDLYLFFLALAEQMMNTSETLHRSEVIDIHVVALVVAKFVDMKKGSNRYFHMCMHGFERRVQDSDIVGRVRSFFLQQEIWFEFIFRFRGLVVAIEGGIRRFKIYGNAEECYAC